MTSATSSAKYIDTWVWVNDTTAPTLTSQEKEPGLTKLVVGILSAATGKQTKTISASGWWASYDKKNKSLATGSLPCNPKNNAVLVDGVAHNDCDELHAAPQGVGIFNDPGFTLPITIAAGKTWSKSLILWGCYIKSCSGSVAYSFVNSDVTNGKPFKVVQRISWDRDYNGDRENLKVDLRFSPK